MLLICNPNLQVIEGVTSSLATIGTIVSLIMSVSLRDLISPIGCKIFWLCNGVFNSSVVYGGFSMALYRLRAIKGWGSNGSHQSTVAKYALLSLLMYLPIVAIVWVSIEYTGTALSLEFCNGYSAAMVHIIKEYEGSSKEDIDFGMATIRSSLVLGQLVTLAELLCYLGIFVHLKRHNERPTLARMITADEIKQRHKKNVITLYGQLAIFLLELVMLTLMTALLSSNQILPPGSYSCCWVVTNAIATMVQVGFASPELRRFYF